MTTSTNPLQALEDKALFPHQVLNHSFHNAYQQFYHDRGHHYVPYMKGGHPKQRPCFEEPKSFFLINIHPYVLDQKQLMGSSIFAIIFVQYLYTNQYGDFVCRHHSFQDFATTSPIKKEQELGLPPKTFAESVSMYGDIETYRQGDDLFNPGVVFKLQPEDYHYFKDFLGMFPQFQEQFPTFLSASRPTHFL